MCKCWTKEYVREEDCHSVSSEKSVDIKKAMKSM